MLIALLGAFVTIAQTRDVHVRQRGFNQRKALIAIYKATGGKEWLHRDGWCL